MLRVFAGHGKTCDGISRREFLTLGGLALLAGRGSLGATAGDSIQPAGFGRAKRCLLLFLTGGPPQLDTWDLKPQAPAEVRGELAPIATSVPGIQISELIPRLAQRADKYCIVRSVTHGDTVHTSAGYTMLTGAPHPMANTSTAANIRATPDDHPHLGALLAKYRHTSGTSGAATAVSLPEYIRDAGVNDFPGQDAGFLGKAYAPLLVDATEDKRDFRPPAIVLPPDVTAARLAERDFLRQRLNQAIDAAAVRSRTMQDHQSWSQRALALLHSTAVQQAFDLGREPAALREAYGPHLFGQGCLLARRLLEAGVSFVTVYWHYEGPDDSPVWDTHWNNFQHLRKRLMPPTDQAFAALLDDLTGRGLLEDTLVICLGEFGRTPRINGKAGRDHWPHVHSLVLAGAGIPGGSVCGSSDAHGAYPHDRPVSPADLTATVLHLLGVPGDLLLHDRLGRPLRACTGTPIAGLVN